MRCGYTTLPGRYCVLLYCILIDKIVEPRTNRILSSVYALVESFRVEEVDINREVDAGGVCEGRNIRDTSRCTV